jgi:hypothetical protein
MLNQPSYTGIDWGRFERPWLISPEKKKLMHSEQETMIWQRFMQKLMYQELAGEIVGLQLEGNFKFPKTAYQFRKYMWRWDLPNLEHRIATRTSEISAQLILIRKGKKRCHYRTSLNPEVGHFWLDKNKLPTLDRRRIHRNYGY